MYNFEKYLIIFLIGGIGYGTIEIAFRGYTHWSMVLTGGSALLSLYIVNEMLTESSIFLKAFAGMLIITTLELIVGIVVNRIFALNVWDYSHIPGNFLGQISPIFSACWYALSLIVFLVFENSPAIIRLQKF